MWFKRISTLVMALLVSLTALFPREKMLAYDEYTGVTESSNVEMAVFEEEQETVFTTEKIVTTVVETECLETEPTVDETQVLETNPTSEETQELETEPAETELQIEEPKYDIIDYEDNQYKIPRLTLNREPGVTESGYVEKITEVPQYFQTYYPKLMYGNSSVRQGGCGIACVSMVLTYLTDKEVTIEELVEKYYFYKTKYGSDYTLFPNSAKDYGVVIEKQTSQWEDVVEALKNGQVVIANPKPKSYFTDYGHFIVLFGITDEGKILVRDPNLYNYNSVWNYPEREDGYANGFDEKHIKYNCTPMWIYAPKDLEAIAERVEVEELAIAETETVENP